MSLALSTLFLVAALIPGIAFVNSYYAGKFTRELASLSTLGELSLYFFWALVIDAVALFAWVGPFPAPDVEFWLRIASGRIIDGDLLMVRGWLRGYGWLRVAWGYALTVSLAVAAGAIARRLIWAFRLDVFVPLLRMKAEWFYALQGRLPGVSRLQVPVADVLVTHPSEGTRLYAGIVQGFESTEDGRLDELMLVATQRHSGRGGEARLRDIPGRVFVVMGPSIHSINMRYHSPQELGLPYPKTRSQVVRAHALAILQALLFEEP